MLHNPNELIGIEIYCKSIVILFLFGKHELYMNKEINKSNHFMLALWRYF